VVREPHRLGAREAARLIERGELKPETLIRSCLERIAARDGEVRAWAFVNREPAMQHRGPLSGIPVGAKDVYDTFDMPTEYDSPIYRGHRPATDAATIALTRRAGGTILGKTATAQFATMVPTVTRNPHNLGHTPGGSSSGSGAAVADFMVPLAFGTQTSGSVLRPASYCGVVGYKPTYDLLPRAGIKPNADSFDTVGWLARSVDDAAFLLDALTSIKPGTIDRPRIGWCRIRANADMEGMVERAARALEAREVQLPAAFKDLLKTHRTIHWYEGARSLADEYSRHRGLLAPQLIERCEAGLAMDPRDYLAALQHAAQCRAMMSDVFGDCDVLITAAATGEAPAGLASTGDTSANATWTLLHGPCVAIPAGKGATGLPLGLQVIGRMGDDARTLACAKWIEEKCQP
jgi:Asp-tRNA(Asn)/Glu-tRNA(Gln) amidotransferase A subunit family amidase